LNVTLRAASHLTRSCVRKAAFGLAINLAPAQQKPPARDEAKNTLILIEILILMAEYTWH